MSKDQFGKRARINITRAGVIEEVFYVCYYCPAELNESELEQHNCEEGKK